MIQRVTAEVLTPLRDLASEAEALAPGSDALSQAHAEVVAALHAAVKKVELIIDYYEQADPALLDQAIEQRDESAERFEEWHRQLQVLVDDSVA